MSGFQTASLVFTSFTILTILSILFAYYSRFKSKSNNNRKNIQFKDHEINIRFRSREYVILFMILIIETIFFIQDAVSRNDNDPLLTISTIWLLTLTEIQILLVWYIQEQRQISVLNMILRILSLSFTLLFGWIFILILLFHDQVHQMRICLYIIFIINFILSMTSIIHNVFCRHKIKYIKIQSPYKPFAVNFVLFLLAFTSLFEIIKCVPLQIINITIYRILTFISILLICFIITFRKIKNSINIPVGGSYKNKNIDEIMHALKPQQTELMSNNDINLIFDDEQNSKTNKLCISSTIDMIDEEDEENNKAKETMYEYGRRTGNKSWQTVASTFIGGENVGKTLLIRSLWKLDITSTQQKFKKKSTNNHHTNSGIDNNDLLQYDRYNMIDLYRRWDPILRVKFKFWDTVGDLRFLNSILQCMLSSEVIVAMYCLENNEKEEEENKQRAETVQFLLDLDDAIHQLLDGKKLKFAVLLIGISKSIITDKLREKNKKIYNLLSTQCKHLIFHLYQTKDGDPSQIFYINYTNDKESKLSSLVQILWSIYQFKKLAIKSKYITDNRYCCNLIKVPTNILYDTPSSLLYRIKNQPFVLRKIDQNKNKKYMNFINIKSLHQTMSVSLYANLLQQKETKTHVLGGPIASVQYWTLKRPKLLILRRTIGCLLSGIIFPYLVVMQTTMFWCYCEEWGISNEGLSRLVSNYRISQFGTFLLDFLYPIFPRSQPDPAIQSAINTGLRSLLNAKQLKCGMYKIDWFFRQTYLQKVLRTIITFSIVLFSTFIAYNLIYWFHIEYNNDEIKDEKYRISQLESVGGLIWFIIIWFMISSWYGGRVNIEPDVDGMFAEEDRTSFRMHYKDTSYGNNIIHTNVEVFLRSYTFYHSLKSKRFKISYLKTTMFVSISLIYALIPGFHRIIFDNKSFFVEEHPYIVIRAIFLNFVLILLVQYVFDKAFYSYFKEYQRLMFDITRLIEIPGNIDKFANDETASYRGSGFEFLSLDDPQNLISWLEIRSYAFAKGRQLFAELELFISVFCICMVCQAIWIVVTLFKNQSESIKQSISASFLGVLFMLIINFGWMIKVFILGIRFDQYQRRQQYALINQMTCIRSEALTTAIFTGPIRWIQLSVGTWNKLYKLLRETRKKYVHSMLDTDDDENNNDIDEVISDLECDDDDRSDDHYKEKFKKLKKKLKQHICNNEFEGKKWREMRSLQEDFDHYLDLLMLVYRKVKQNSIHPKIFGLGLSGTLMKTMMTALLTTVVAIIRFLFF